MNRDWVTVSVVIVWALCVMFVSRLFFMSLLAERPRPVAEAPLRTHEVGLLVASWYGPGFAGKRTASGTVYNPSGLTAAHRTLPFGTRLLLGLRGKWVEVVVTDRGPVPLERDLDVSEGAAVALGFRDAGLAILEVIQLEKK